MSDNAVSNSSCLIALDRIGRLEFLSQSFNQVSIPPAVKKEFGRNVDWLSVVHVRNSALVSSLQTQIGEGESEAIALAMEAKPSILILDDKKARRIANQLGLKVIGTVVYYCGRREKDTSLKSSFCWMSFRVQDSESAMNSIKGR